MALKKQKQSVPKNVIVIAKEIARLKNIDETTCARIIYQTTKSFFSI
jgi:Tat protein secretion system quality control protein TatD with DNase activity